MEDDRLTLRELCNGLLDIQLESTGKFKIDSLYVSGPSDLLDVFVNVTINYPQSVGNIEVNYKL